MDSAHALMEENEALPITEVVVPPVTQRLRSASHKSTTGLRATNHEPITNLQSASPEVISSLISSLSAIAAPLEDHFNNLPNIDDDPGRIGSLRDAEWSHIPQFVQETARRPSNGVKQNISQSTGFGVDYGAYKLDEADEDSYLPPSDAAIAPVIRLAKPSVSSSSLPISRTGSRTALGVRISQQSLRTPSDVVSIGIPSTEQPLLSSSASVTSSRRSSRRQNDNKENVNDERPGSESRDSKTSDNGINMLGRAARKLRPTFSNRSLTSSSLSNTKPHSLPSPQANTSLRVSSKSPSTPVSPTESAVFNGPNKSHLVPSRQSSLRHSTNGSPGMKQSRFSHTRHSSGSRDLKDLGIDPDLIEEDHQTVRRIRELQEVKEKRERELRHETRKAEKDRTRKSVSDAPQSFHRASLQADRHSATDVQHRFPEDRIPPRSESRNSTTNRANRPLSMTTGGSSPVKPASVKDVRPTKMNSAMVDSPMRQRALSSDHSRTASMRLSSGFDRSDSADSIEDAVNAYLKAARLTQRVRHPHTGRYIAFSEVGDPNGFAVFCCVGMGLTRYLTAFYDELAKTLRLRLITPDRPGVGESEPCLDGSGTPLNWADDVAIICNHLGITKFSLLAHSAGAIYALATALRMSQQIRGQLHLMAPWIPPSQMTNIGSEKEPLPTTNVPYSQKILRILPASFLKAANSSLLSARSASLATKSPRSRSSKRRGIAPEDVDSPPSHVTTGTGFPDVDYGSSPQAMAKGTASRKVDPSSAAANMHGIGAVTAKANRSNSLGGATNAKGSNSDSIQLPAAVLQNEYDDRLTQGIWDLATTNANPAVDLIVCLERRQPIGFRYADVTRSVVIHHGSKDTRVPVENVRWLGKIMRRCEVRILEGEGHGLMANAGVMGAVLGEVAKEWEDWWVVTQAKGDKTKARRVKAEKEANVQR